MRRNLARPVTDYVGYEIMCVRLSMILLSIPNSNSARCDQG